MINQFSRTELLLGSGALKEITSSCIAVFGLGGVGSYVVEGLARMGVASFILVDDDTICLTNLNRQIIATHDTIGQSKVMAAKARILKINPDAEVKTYATFYNEATMHSIDLSKCHYIVDAVDTVFAKIRIIQQAKHLSIPVISSMGTGNKIDPTQFKVADIQKTSVCPLARIMRKELKKRRIKQVKVVFSTEVPLKIDRTLINTIKSEKTDQQKARHTHSGKVPPGSCSFVPPVAGLIIVSEIIKDLTHIKKRKSN